MHLLKSFINKLFYNKKLWNEKKIEKLLLIVTVANLKGFITKNKLIIYSRIFVKLYNQKNYK